MRLLGTVLLVAATAAIGLLKSLEVRKHPVILREFSDALLLIRNEIATKNALLSDAITQAAETCSECVRPFFSDLSAAMMVRDSLFAESWAQTAALFSGLNPPEREALGRLGLHLGKYDKETQLKAIDTCIEQFRIMTAQANQDAKQFGRLYAGIGLTVGSMLAVALY